MRYTTREVIRLTFVNVVAFWTVVAIIGTYGILMTMWEYWAINGCMAVIMVNNAFFGRAK